MSVGNGGINTGWPSLHHDTYISEAHSTIIGIDTSLLLPVSLKQNNKLSHQTLDRPQELKKPLQTETYPPWTLPSLHACQQARNSKGIVGMAK